MHADLVFQACISFLRCFRTPGAPRRKILVHTGMLPCLVPWWAQIMQILYLVPISFWMLTLLGTFYKPISFYRRVSRFEGFQTKVVHSCCCLVCIKMPLLIWSPKPRFWKPWYFQYKPTHPCLGRLLSFPRPWTGQTYETLETSKQRRV